MSNAVRWVPRATKVDPFHAQVGRGQQLLAGRYLQDCAIIADPAYYLAMRDLAGQAPDAVDAPAAPAEPAAHSPVAALVG